MAKIIKLTKNVGGNISINPSEIKMMENYKEQKKAFSQIQTKIILKDDTELIVKENQEEIHNLMKE